MKKILIIGLGLIGGSFARAISQHKLADEIWAFDNNFDAISLAKKEKIVDGFSLIDENLRDFDLIAIATPLIAYEDLLKQLGALGLAKTIIIDLGSVKDFIFKILPKNLEQNFVACHPIAGLDKSGFESSVADLFSGKKFVICKKNGNEKAAKIVEDIVLKIGAKPEFIDPKAHDEIYALMSHLPQFLSFLTKDFSPQTLNNTFFIRSFRLDDSSADIWADIFKINGKNIEKFYFEFFDNFVEFVEKIEQKKYDESYNFLVKNVDVLGNSLGNSLEENASENVFKNLPNADKFKIVLRAIIVASYLKIKKIDSLREYAGSGFKDFTSIASCLNFKEEIAAILQKNSKEILDFAKKIGY